MEEKSFGPCEELVFGRISFRGFNPEVEVCVSVTNYNMFIWVQALQHFYFSLLWQKLMEVLNPKQKTETEEVETGRMQTDVTDEEMAQR